MSSKRRKSNNQLWYICDICKSVMQVKDTLVHRGNRCPSNEKHFEHPFIRNDILYTTVEAFNTEDVPSLKSIETEKQNDFILMSVNVLQLIKVSIGDPVVIYPKNSESCIPFVKSVWPNTGNSLAVSLTREGTLLNSLTYSDVVSVHALRENISVVKQITVHCEDNHHVLNEPEFLAKLKEQNLNKIYCLHNKFLYNYYGKILIFTVIDIQSLYETSTEDKKLYNKNSSSHHEKSNHQFFVVTEETVWKLDEKILLKSSNICSFDQIGGMDETLKELEEIVSLSLLSDACLQGLFFPRGIIIYGPGGTGKTSIVKAIAKKFKMNIVNIESSLIFSKYMGEAERHLQSYFEKAKQLSPSIILIDELEVLCPKITVRNDQEKRIIATLSLLLDRLHSEDNISVIVFATTSKLMSVNKSLRRPGRFGKEIEIHVPNANQRREILKLCLQNVNHDVNDSDVKEISDLSYGFVGADLVSLVSKAILRSKRNKTAKVSVQDFHWALSKIKPSGMREILIDIPNVKWCDIGGQDELKLKLRQAIEWPLKYENSFKRLGIIPPRGILMFGPPGCSKTMIAKALATESKLNFIPVKGPELFSKWVGESEKAIREVFRRARQVAPSIVFFDELDAIGCERNNVSGGSNVEERVLAQLLTELDGVEALGNVTIVGATNRLDRIDPALLRPGRFDRIIYVPLPDDKTRRHIFEIQFKKMPVSDDVNLEELVDKTEGYSGAEIVAVCHEAALKALESDLTSTFILRRHFITALTIILPRTPQSLLTLYDNYLQI